MHDATLLVRELPLHPTKDKGGQQRERGQLVERLSGGVGVQRGHSGDAAVQGDQQVERLLLPHLVDDGRSRRLQQHARRLGYPDLRSYLQARCDAGYSLPALAEELGESQWTISQALATQRITLPPRPE